MEIISLPITASKKGIWNAKTVFPREDAIAKHRDCGRRQAAQQRTARTRAATDTLWSAGIPLDVRFPRAHP